jgi:hypothetical protein
MDITSLGGESSGIASIIRFIIFRRIAAKPGRRGRLCAKSWCPTNNAEPAIATVRRKRLIDTYPFVAIPRPAISCQD